MLHKLVLTTIGTAILCGCATTRPVTLTAPFDAKQARAMLAPGANRIVGSALIRQQGGGTVTCAGLAVYLIPVTPYATERMMHLYGSDQRGFHAIGLMVSPVTFEPDYPEYMQATRHVMGDTQGMFEFPDVGDGDYYVTTSITWDVGMAPQGGGLMQRVHVSGGETQKVVLSP